MMSKNRKSIDVSREPLVRPGKPGGRRDRNRKERLKVLSQSALELFLVQGIEATTIEHITQAASMAKGSFYRYFEDKESLVSSLFEAMHQTIESLLVQCALDVKQAGSNFTRMNQSYEVMGVGMATYFFENPQIVQLYLQESRGPRNGPTKPVRAIADLVEEKAIEITRQAYAQELLRPFPAEISALVVVGACEKLLCAHFDGVDLGPPAMLVESLTSLVSDGLRAG